MFFQDNKVIDTAEAFAGVFRYELLPLLQEYFYDDYRALADILGAVIDSDTQQLTEVVYDPEALCAELATKFGSASA